MQVFQVPKRALQLSSLSPPCSSSVRTGLLCTSHPMSGSSVVESRRRVSSSPSGAAQGSSDKDTKKPTDAPKEERAEAAAASKPALEESSSDPGAAALARQAARDAIIQEILSRDKVIFELKRQHELSMLRVEQSQARVLKDQEDRGMYYEQNSNVHTFDTISVGLYSQRSTLYHTLSAERLRNLKIFLMVFTTLMTCVYFYYRYVINPDWAYVEKPLKMIGSRVQAVREQRWRMLSDEERFDEMRSKEQSYGAQK